MISKVSAMDCVVILTGESVGRRMWVTARVPGDLISCAGKFDRLCSACIRSGGLRSNFEFAQGVTLAPAYSVIPSNT
jgi:hypothetical protein